MLSLRVSAFEQVRAYFSLFSAPASRQDAVAELAAPINERKVLNMASAELRADAAKMVQQLVAEAPYAVAVAVVDATTGLPLAHTDLPGAPASAVSLAVQFARVARRTIEMAAAVTGPTEKMAEIIYTSADHVHLLRPTANGAWWIYMALETAEPNLAIVRAVLQAVGDTETLPTAAAASLQTSAA